MSQQSAPHGVLHAAEHPVRLAEAHFGLGPVEKLARLRVRWPSGATQSIEDVPVDRVITIEERAP